LNFLANIWAWLCSWFIRPPLYSSVCVEEVPDHLDPFTVYIAGEGEYVWFFAMLCPCGCDETVFLNAQKETRPRWKIESNEGEPISLSPSVWRKVGCQSHFFLRRGVIEWCRD
jgi:hypothetical protein